MSNKKELAVKESAELEIYDFGDAVGAGADVEQSEIGVPFMNLVQSNSTILTDPAVKIEGAAAGMLHNTGSGEVKDSYLLVPAIRTHTYVEWTPRNKGGGFVASRDPNDPIVQAAIERGKVKDAEGKERFQTPEGNELVETFSLFCIELDPETEEPLGMVVVPFKSMGIKVYKKQFMNRVCSFMFDTGNGKINPPMCAHRFVLSSVDESHENYHYKNFKVTFLNDNDLKKSMMGSNHPAYIAGKELHDVIKEGKLKADFTKAETNGAEVRNEF